MNYPENLKYTKDHEWIAEIDGEYRVGITDFAQSELGEIVYVDITSVDEEVAMSDVFGSIEAVKTVSDLLMPVSGQVLAANEALEEHPELVNEDPYGAGWLVKVAPADMSQFDELLSAAEYIEWIGK